MIALTSTIEHYLNVFCYLFGWVRWGRVFMYGSYIQHVDPLKLIAEVLPSNPLRVIRR